MTMNVLAELRRVGHSLPAKAPPIPITFSQTGVIGHVENRRGIYLNPATERFVHALMRDNYRAERAARQLTDGRLGAGDILPIARLGTDSLDAIRAIQSMKAAITSMDGVVAARAGGKSWDFIASKASQTTVAASWSSFLRTGGVPGAITFNNVPGPAALDASTAGAVPLPMTLGAGEYLYLTNMGLNHATGTNISLLVDAILAAGNIGTNATTTTAVSTTALPRWTGGAGLMMTLEITTALGATASNVTVKYTDQDGNTAQNTAATALLTSGIAGRLVPVQDGPLIRFAAGDYGVRAISEISCSAAMGAGVVAAIVYKPVLLVPTLATSAWYERSTPAQLGGIRQLTEITAASSKPCLGWFVLTSGTSTGVQVYLLETCWG